MLPSSGPAPLARLLQLASPALPVGAYSYSQGLETAVELGFVTDEAGAGDWIGQVLDGSFGRFELPVLARLFDAWDAGDPAQVTQLNALFLAGRESCELRAETLQMGYSLARLADDLDEAPASLKAWTTQAAVAGHISFPAVWSALALAWDVPRALAVEGYAWSWAENQVLAAVKLVPLGQSAGQRLLWRLGAAIGPAARQALETAADAGALCNFAPGAAICSARHETQYSRLFRS